MSQDFNWTVDLTSPLFRLPDRVFVGRGGGQVSDCSPDRTHHN